MKLEKIRIKKFRHMESLEVKFGKKLTVISGQNGTGKSTILGLVGQIFDYKGKEKTKNNSKFATKYSEIFRFCPIYDKSGTHEYEATLEDDNGEEVIKEAKSRFVKGEGKHGRFRIDIGDRDFAGKGAIDFPVIYLGLKRLFPLAQEKEDSIKIKELKLTDAEKRFYNKYAKDILILLDRSITPQDIKSPNKEFLAMKTSKYSNLGNSAGQDNLGQILTAILSFRELKEKLGDDYKGGILLVDEVDATLYAGSQINLLNRLYKFSNEYNLQIIFTTHSLEILELLKEKDNWETEINFFEVLDNKVKNNLNPSLVEIRDKILVQTKRHEKIEKIRVLCEDEVNEIWCKNLLNGTDIKKKVEVKKVPISAEILKELAKKRHPAFKKMIFVLDGDKRNSDSERLPRTVFLPGTYFPEKIFYKLLYSLNEEDDYWDNEDHFTKQVCFNRFIGINSLGRYKNWFTQKCGCIGNKYPKLFKRWKKENPGNLEKFQEEFKGALDSILN